MDLVKVKNTNIELVKIKETSMELVDAYITYY